MQQREINKTTKETARKYAKKVLEERLSCKVTEIKYIGGGSFGYVYKARIDKAPHTVIMKACRTGGMCVREAKELTLLGDNSLMKVPEVYFTFLGTADIPLDFICMEMVPGHNCFTDLTKLFASKRAKLAFADQVTAAMREWHCITNDTFGLVEDPRFDTWLDYYKPFALDILQTARELTKQKKLQKSVLRVMESAFSAFDFIFSEPVEKASLIHGDLNVMNIMADGKLNPVAIIDPLESKWGDREYDLFQLRNLTGDCFYLYKTYKSKYPVSEKCDIKIAFYALYHEVYCFILSGRRDDLLLLPLVRRMKKELKKRELLAL